MPKLLSHRCTNCATNIRMAFNVINEAVALLEIILDADHKPVILKLIEINDAFKRIFGPIHENPTEKTLGQTVPFQSKNLIAVFSKVAITGEPIQLDYPERLSGEFYRMNIAKIDDKKIIAVFTDITLEKKAREIGQKHQILFENAQDIILYVKMDGSIADANRYAIEKYGYSKEEILTKKIQDIRHPSTMKFFEKQMLQADKEGILFECVHRKKDGTSFPVEVSAKSTDTSEGRFRIHIIRDITERKMHEEKITRLANYDYLTGIPNRANLLNHLAYAVEYAKRNKLKIAVMLFDVDKFKSINDRFGHAAGDAVLQYVAENAKSVLRKADIIGRLGGDEFIIVQTDLKDAGDASVLAEKVMNAVKKPLCYNGEELSVSVSIGICIYPNGAEDEKMLMHLADQAMYEAKQMGGGNFNFAKV